MTLALGEVCTVKLGGKSCPGSVVRLLPDGRVCVRLEALRRSRVVIVPAADVKGTGRQRGRGRPVGAFSTHGIEEYRRRGELLNKPERPVTPREDG